jgi:hypothetical protein
LRSRILKAKRGMSRAAALGALILVVAASARHGGGYRKKGSIIKPISPHHPQSDASSTGSDTGLPPHPDDKLARKTWKDSCTEAGFCGNLKPLDNGDPHPNCGYWKKDCPCNCRKHRPKPPKPIKQLPTIYPVDSGISAYKNLKSTRGTIEALGTVDLAAFPKFHTGLTPVKEDKTTIPPPADGPPKVALICFNNGHLPMYINYFIATAKPNGPMIDYFIFHTEDETDRIQASAPNVHVKRLPIEELATRLQKVQGDECEAKDTAALVKTLQEVYTIHHTIPYTIHHTPYTIHHTPYTIHHTPYTIPYSPYAIHRTL